MMRIGILGAGVIARAMSATVRGMKERGDAVELYAVASRSQEKADAFAKEQGVTKAYGSYEAMLRDPEVDLVYIATPHAFHGEQIIDCVRHGKAVLCEKAFTGNARQAEEALTLAEKEGVPVTEAIWTRYMPSRQMLLDLIDQGTIGEVRTVTANLGYAMTQKERILRPELAGGALLDLGVYTINFASMILGGDVTDVQSTVRLFDTGCDLEESIQLTYANGTSAQLYSTAGCRTDRHGNIYGTEGRLQVDNINNPHLISVYNTKDQLLRTLPVPEQITGYEYQVTSCMKALATGALECPEMPHAETLRVMRLMDTLRKQWGMVYPFD